MAQPPSYNRGYDFSSFQTNNPDEALPATQLESEFDAIKTTIDAILVNLAILQRDDTALANQIVTPETFSQDALVLAKVSEFGIRGNWATGTVYAVNDIVNYNSATYIAVAAHTASAAFGSDSGHWVLLANAAIDTTSSAVDQFVGTGSQTAFTTSYTYNSNTDVLVFVDGQLQTPVDDYSVSGTTVTFTSAPAAPAITGRENVIIWGPSVPAANAVASAQTQASNAAASATTAAGHVTSAQAAQTASESARDDSQTARDDSQTARDASQTAQTASESARDTAQDHRNDAQKLATNAEDSQFTLADGTTTGYSALHHKEKALDAQQNAETAETNAETAQTAAEGARDTAQDHRDDAQKIAVNAEDAQYTLADGSTTGYSALHYKEKAADAQTASETARDAAVTARNAAQTAQSAAESARDSALTAYDNFDDRMLGNKTSDPSTDNDGDALVAGALYFNTTTNTMMLYTGSAWVAAYVSGGSFASLSGATFTGDVTVPNLITSGNVDGRDVSVDGTKLDGIAAGAEVNVNADFNATSGDAQILNKPTTIAGYGITDAFDGAYSSLTGTPTIPTNNNQLTNGAGYLTSADGGNADTLDSFHASTTRDAANTIPVRDGNGYLQLGWINTTSGATTNTIDRIYASNDGYIRYVTPATLKSQLNVLEKSGGTMTGNLSIVKNAPKLTLDSSSSGSNTNEQSATISLGESGSAGSASLHLAYTGDGYSYIGMGNLGSDNIPDYRAMRFYYTNDNVHFYDSLTCAGNITAYSSDRRLKENIQTIDNAMDMVSRLRGVTFDWKDGLEDLGFSPDMKTETGLIAQELQEVIPDAVVPAPFDHDESGSISGENYLTVKPEKVIPVLIEAIKELKAEIETLKKG